jgi:3-oxoadipate enol-lactonase
MPYASLPGVRLYYEEAGRGFPLLLVHGIGNSHSDWEFQIPAFARRRRVIAPDLRGHGLSEHAGDYRIERFAADCWALLDALGVRRCELLGHSMGGAVVLQMAVEQPQRVRRLIAADTLPSFAIDSFDKGLMFAFRYVLMGLLGPRRLARSVARRLYPAPGQAWLRERALQRARKVERAVYLEILRHLVAWSVADRLERLTMPVLVAAAEHDYFPLSQARAFASALPRARLKVFRGRHHEVPLEAPRAFNAVVLRFLEEPAPRKRRARG